MRLNQPLKTPISFMTLSRPLTIIIVLTRTFRSICFTLYTQSSYQTLKICKREILIHGRRGAQILSRLIY